MRKIVGIFIGAIVVAVITASCNINPDIKSDNNTPEKEQQLLKEYLNGLVAEGHDIDTTDLGVYYVMVHDSSTAIYPQTGDTVVVGYSGYLINGNLFDTSDWHSDDGKFEFVLGVDPMLEGWNDGIKHISNGSTVQLIIPSDYAYGSLGAGNGAIPPYSTVIFVVQVFDIRSPDAG